MTKFVHIVYVHPVENGEPNLHKVKDEQEFETKELAEFFVRHYTEPTLKAVYYGCVNDATGELV
jgi:hypothetical protein